MIIQTVNYTIKVADRHFFVVAFELRGSYGWDVTVLCDGEELLLTRGRTQPSQNAALSFVRKAIEKKAEHARLAQMKSQATMDAGGST